MNAFVMNVAGIEASCAICGAPPVPECFHEGQRLEMAITQALDRWDGVATIRQWVLNHARNQVIHTFQHLKQTRIDAHYTYLQRLPCYTVYERYNGNPPLPVQQIGLLRAQIVHAEGVFKQGIDEDWRKCCMKYPEVLDYYFRLVHISFPEETDEALRDPRFGGQKKVRARDQASEDGDKAARRKGKHRDGGGRTPPPRAPTPGRRR